MKRASVGSRGSSRQQSLKVQSRLADPNAPAPARRMQARAAGDANVQIDAALKNGLFRVFPSKKLMNSRTLPEELRGKPKIFGNEGQIESLFRYTKKIATQFFSASALKNLFPLYFVPDHASRLSFMSASSRSSLSGSRIPVRRSSVTPAMGAGDGEDTSLASGFKVLSNLILDNKAKACELADFCLLYVATAMVIGSESAVANALSFLERFLKLGCVRTAEVNVLFAVMMRLSEVSASFRKPVVADLSKLAALDGSLVVRLENGATHRNPELSGLCKDVLKTMGRADRGEDRFGSISNDADEQTAIESLGKFVETLEDNGQPSDIVNFVRNITSVMTRFRKSTTVLERSAACLDSVLPFTQDIPMELVYEMLDVCLTILSGEMFLDAGNAFETVELLQSLQNTIIEHVATNTVATALAGLIAKSNGQKLEMILSLLDEYVSSKNIDPDTLRKIADNMEAFHPEHKLPQYLQEEEVLERNVDPIRASIERLCNPDTYSAELSTIVAQSDAGDFQLYPDELRPILQCAWIVAHGARPENCDDDTYQTTLKIMDELTAGDGTTASLEQLGIFE